MAERLTPKLLAYDLVQASEPQVSPDGTEVIYTRVDVDPETHQRRRELRRCAIDGADDRPLMDAAAGASNPRWSPDGATIALTRSGSGGNALLAWPADGRSDPRQLAQSRNEIGDLAWSPDGSQLAYTSVVDPTEPGEPARSPRVRVTSRLDYKQDGRGFVGEARRQIFVVAAAGAEPKQLSTRSFDHQAPAWSPDGRMLATSVVHTPGLGAELCVLDVSTGEAQWFEPADSRVETYAWSASGAEIAFTAHPAGDLQQQFYVANVASGTTRRVTHDLPSLPVGAGLWLDDRQLLFQAVRGGASGLEILDTRDGGIRVVERWLARNGPMTWDRGGNRFAFGFDTLTDTGEIRVYDRSGGTSRVITANNGAIFAARPPALWERFDIKRGEFTIEAWLLKPPDFDPTRRYPVILDVHGGPTGHYGYAFMAHQQVWASNGFLVVFANARGSNTYGRTFAQQIVCDWGGEDYFDNLAALDAVLMRPYADPERTAIYGYSYGGYVCSWALGHTDRFKAAVCGSPMFDLLSCYGTADYAGRGIEIHLGGRPQDIRDEYIRRSPSTYIHHATTPTLVIEGEDDQRVPMNQAEQLFVLLKKAGVETQFARYPGGSHMFFAFGIPEHRADFLRRTLEWYRSHLGSDDARPPARRA